MKSIFIKVLLIGFLQLLLSPLWACDFSNPHSFTCQHETFSGSIFPLMPLNFALLDENWIPSQFTGQSATSIFQTVTARSSRTRTCGVINQDRSLVGVMKFNFSRNEIRKVKIARFGSKRTSFISRSRVSFENSHTVIFGAASESFRCRIFERVRTPHLLCQYFSQGKFVGYLGLLPHQVSCR